MDLYIQCYLTDAKKIKKIFGCKNKLFLETIIKKLKMDIEDLDDDYDEQIDVKNNATKIIEDIIKGEITCHKIPYMYGLIYEKLVAVFGEQIYSPNDEFNTVFYSKSLVSNSAFINIPVDFEIPKILSIEIADLEITKQKFESLKKIENIDDADLKIIKKDYLFAFNKAIKEQKDLVFVMS